MVAVPRRTTWGLTPQDLARFLKGLDAVQDQTGRFFAQCGTEPAFDSSAAHELKSFPSEEFVRNAYAQGELLVQVCFEHLALLGRALVEPVLPIAVWTSARSLLESAALASWLLDPSIDVRLRVGRSLAFRFEGLSQQVRIARAAEGAAEADKIEERLRVLASHANQLGYPILKNRRGRAVGIAEPMPSTTVLAGVCLRAEMDYRLMSAVVHAHPSVVQQVAYAVTNSSPAVVGNPAEPSPQLFIGRKVLRPEAVVFLLLRSLKFFAEPLRRKVRLNGFDGGRLNEIFEVVVRGHFWWMNANGYIERPAQWNAESEVMNLG